MSSARAVALGLASSGITPADPTHHGMLDVAGLDKTEPAVIADFYACDLARNGNPSLCAVKLSETREGRPVLLS